MADTDHARNSPVEGDGVSYPAIGWFLVVLVTTVVVSQLFVWGLFRTMVYYRSPAAERAPLAAPVMAPTLEDGRVVRGDEGTPGPGLLVDEPAALRAFRAEEEQQLEYYGWVMPGVVVRLPIEHAKALLLERGVPTREPSTTPEAPAAASTEAR